MSSGKCAAESGCNYYAFPGSRFCSKHRVLTKEEQALKNANNERRAGIEARRIAEENRVLNEGARWAAEHARPVNGRDKKYLVLGSSPNENRRSGSTFTENRVHYDREDVFLLDIGAPKVGDGHNWSRYIDANFNNLERLQQLAREYNGQFDELAFDSGTLCLFQGTPEHLKHFKTMLKPEGVFYFSDFNPGILANLHAAGFEAKPVRARYVKDNGSTLPALLKYRDDARIIVAKKRSSIRRYDIPEGGRRNTTRRRNTRRKSR